MSNFEIVERTEQNRSDERRCVGETSFFINLWNWQQNKVTPSPFDC